MEEGRQISKEDALFYLDMIDSVLSPNFKPRIGQSKPYYPLLKKHDSEGYTTFIKVYQYFRENLEEREKTVLDLQYRINGKALTMNEIGKLFGISSSRVSQLRNKAERCIAQEIIYFIKGRKRDRNKKCFSTIIKDQPDEMLINIGQAIRKWDPIINNYFNQEQPRYYKKRKKLEEALWRTWEIKALDHREQAIKILNIQAEDIYY